MLKPPCFPRCKMALTALALLFSISLASASDPIFEAQTIDSGVQIGYGLAIGDVNGDGKDDILLADKKDFVWYENPSWERRHFWTVPAVSPDIAMRDNVCIAARDLDGDGKVEVAIGGNWNPNETVSEEKSGGVWYLGSLGDIHPVKLHHEPTTHRMGWVKTANDRFSLVVVPLHGRGNKGGTGDYGSRIFAYELPEDPHSSDWRLTLIEKSLHKTHNFDWFAASSKQPERMLIAGGEGIHDVTFKKIGWDSVPMKGLEFSVGEIRAGDLDRSGRPLSIATIEPMHGNSVVFYNRIGKSWMRTVLDDSMNQGHALVVADFVGSEDLQVVAGWRNPDKEKKVGIKFYQPGSNGKWSTHLIDDNQMACEDIKAADLDGDGKLDLIASGRRSKNVIIYWNRTN